MAGPNFSVFEALSRRMDWLSQRQTVLADNVANADTPGFIPMDLRAAEFESVLKRALAPMAPSVTHSGHVDASVPKRSDARSEESRDTYETKPSGNAVILEEQMVKVSETQMNHALMTNLYRKNMELGGIALGR